MGSGASSLGRLRKAVLIRAYNLRPPEQSIAEQFMPYTFQKEGKGLYITVSSVRKCLKMDTPEYRWIEEVMRSVFSLPTSPPTQKVRSRLFFAFRIFLTRNHPASFSLH